MRLFFRIYPRVKKEFYKRWNKLFFRLIGVQYGKRLVVLNKIYINGPGRIVIGNDFHFTSGDCINAICRNIRGVFYTRTKDAIIEIGDNVGMSSTCIWAQKRITIGNNVNIGGDCIIIDNDAHPHFYKERRNEYMNNHSRDEYLSKIPCAPIQIDDDVWIGARCQILKGVHIGARSIIAAGSIVTRDIPADCVAGGNPAKVIKERSEYV